MLIFENKALVRVAGCPADPFLFLMGSIISRGHLSGVSIIPLAWKIDHKRAQSVTIEHYAYDG